MVALVAGLAMAGGSTAQERVLLDTVVERERLVLEIDHAEVQVFVDPGGEAILQATVDPTQEGAVDLEPLALELEEGDAVVRRRAVAGGPTPRLRVDVLVPPEVVLVVRGLDLLVQLESAVPTEEGGGAAVDGASAGDTGSDGVPGDALETGRQPSEGASGVASAGGPAPPRATAKGAAPLAIELDLADSELIARDVERIGGRLVNSSATVNETRGGLFFEVLQSFLDVEGHRGPTSLTVDGSEVSFSESEGRHRFLVSASSVSIDEASGELAAQLSRGARFTVQGFRGPTTLEGDGSWFEGRRLWATAGKGLEVRGTNLDAVLEDCRGKSYEIHLDGGRFSGSGFVGRGQVTGLNGTAIDLEDTNGRVALFLRNRSTARVAEARGRVEANTESSELEVEDVQQLKLTAKDSTVRARGLDTVTDFRAQGSELDIDLTTLRNTKPIVHLLAETRGEIRLAAPCLVQVKSEDALGASNVSVSGCELKRHGEGNRSRAPTRTDGTRMIRLTLDVAPDAEVDVVGY